MEIPTKLIALLICFLFSSIGCGTGCSDSRDKEKESPPHKIVGKWIFIKGEAPRKTNLVFAKDGKYVHSWIVSDQQLGVDGTYTVDGDSVAFVQQERTGTFDNLVVTERRFTSKIKELTDENLILETDGKTLEYRRENKSK